MKEIPTKLNEFQDMKFDLDEEKLNESQRSALKRNIDIVRDSIIFVTALASAKGLGGHTGGPYDVAPEMLIVEGLINGGAPIEPVLYDEAGHRVAIQYVMATLRGDLDPESLWHYREAHWRLPGHPEAGYTPGVKFSSGRLGHLWSFVNGVSKRKPDHAVCLFGSDGSQQEGNSAEAARIAVENRLNVKLIIDDNDITIAGHPSNYIGSFDLEATLSGHGMPVTSVDGEDFPALYHAIRQILIESGPRALLVKRKIATGVPNIEGMPAAHDVISVSDAIEYFESRQNEEAISIIKSAGKIDKAEKYFFSKYADKDQKVRDAFGRKVANILATRPREKLLQEVLVVDSDLEGSCGLHHIRKAFPDIYVSAGIMERSNFSLASGFGAQKGSQGIFGTFAAFSEMIISELTMARLNGSNVLCHFSHSGIDDIADNTCHFGVNNMFLDNGFGEHDTTELYFPCDEGQLNSILRTIFDHTGVRIIMSTRSSLPQIQTADNVPLYDGEGEFQLGRDDVVRDGELGWVVSYGDMLHRCLDAVDKLKLDGFDVGLINKAHLNRIDEQSMAMIGNTRFVAVVESQNKKTGLGVRYGSALLERGFHPIYRHFGVTKDGCGGLDHQVLNQGLDSASIYNRIREILDTK